MATRAVAIGLGGLLVAGIWRTMGSVERSGHSDRNPRISLTLLQQTDLPTERTLKNQQGQLVDPAAVLTFRTNGSHKRVSFYLAYNQEESELDTIPSGEDQILVLIPRGYLKSPSNCICFAREQDPGSRWQVGRTIGRWRVEELPPSKRVLGKAKLDSQVSAYTVVKPTLDGGKRYLLYLELSAKLRAQHVRIFPTAYTYAHDFSLTLHNDDGSPIPLPFGADETSVRVKAVSDDLPPGKQPPRLLFEKTIPIERK